MDGEPAGRRGRRNAPKASAGEGKRAAAPNAAAPASMPSSGAVACWTAARSACANNDQGGHAPSRHERTRVRPCVRAWRVGEGGRPPRTALAGLAAAAAAAGVRVRLVAVPGVDVLLGRRAVPSLLWQSTHCAFGEGARRGRGGRRAGEVRGTVARRREVAAGATPAAGQGGARAAGSGHGALWAAAGSAAGATGLLGERRALATGGRALQYSLHGTPA